jgi:putative transposase
MGSRCVANPSYVSCGGRRSGWVEHVNEPLTEAEFKAVQRSVERGCPFGRSTWSERTVHKLGLESTLRAHGRPKKQKNGS